MPWTLKRDKRGTHSHFIMSGAACVAKVNEFVDDEGGSNAAHIVKCVNSHDELVAALELVHADLESGIIAQHSHAAEKRRMRHQSKLEELLTRARQ